MAAKLKRNRPTWDEYFMNMAKVAQERSNCLRGSVGAVMVRNKRVIATGYNGAPIGVKDCIDGGCERCLRRHQNKIRSGEEKALCICLHAEQNAILQSAYHGMSTLDAALYSTVEPCMQCAKELINAGVREVIYAEKNDQLSSKKLFTAAGVKVRKL